MSKYFEKVDKEYKKYDISEISDAGFQDYLEQFKSALSYELDAERIEHLERLCYSAFKCGFRKGIVKGIPK